MKHCLKIFTNSFQIRLEHLLGKYSVSQTSLTFGKIGTSTANLQAENLCLIDVQFCLMK